MRKNLPIILLSALVVIGLLVGVGYYFQTYRHGEAPEEGLTVVTAAVSYTHLTLPTILTV